MRRGSIPHLLTPFSMDLLMTIVYPVLSTTLYSYDDIPVEKVEKIFTTRSAAEAWVVTATAEAEALKVASKRFTELKIAWNSKNHFSFEEVMPVIPRKMQNGPERKALRKELQEFHRRANEARKVFDERRISEAVVAWRAEGFSFDPSDICWNNCDESSTDYTILEMELSE